MFMFTPCMQDPAATRRGFGCPRTGITGCLPAFLCVQGTELRLSAYQLKTSVTKDRGAGFPPTESHAPLFVPWCFQTHGCEGKEDSVLAGVDLKQ